MGSESRDQDLGLSREEAEHKVKDEVDGKAKETAECEAIEEVASKVNDEAERKAKDETNRKSPLMRFKAAGLTVKAANKFKAARTHWHTGDLVEVEGRVAIVMWDGRPENEIAT